MNPKRKEDESFEDYKARQKMYKKLIDQRLKNGIKQYVSSRLVKKDGKLYKTQVHGTLKKPNNG